VIPTATQHDVLRVEDIDREVVNQFLDRFGLTAVWIAEGAAITASFWGEPEAGIIGHRVFVRGDTPVHSMLHEVCHIICMSCDRRAQLERDAGGDDQEESAVCYLQIVLADYLAGVGRERLMLDMDAWGYSFRLGSTKRWFAEDAVEAKAWLEAEGLLSSTGEPLFCLRGEQQKQGLTTSTHF
jgi:hypothetical protein